MADDMLTVDVLKDNVEGLTDEQATKALKLLGNRIGQIHGAWEKDLEIAFGMKKPEGVKGYNFLKEEVEKIKSATKQTGISEDDFNALKSDYEKLKSSKGGEDFTTKLSEKDSLIEQIKAQYESEKTEWQKALSEKDNEMSSSTIKTKFELAFKGLKRKDYSIIGESTQNAAYEKAMSNILSTTTQSIENGKVVFKDKDGKVLLNKSNGLEPYTEIELLMEQKVIKEILDEGTQATGAGTKPSKTNTGISVSIGAAKTKPEATEAIRKGLFAKGLTVNDASFQAEFDKAYKDNEVSKLPMR